MGGSRPERDGRARMAARIELGCDILFRVRSVATMRWHNACETTGGRDGKDRGAVVSEHGCQNESAHRHAGAGEGALSSGRDRTDRRWEPIHTTSRQRVGAARSRRMSGEVGYEV